MASSHSHETDHARHTNAGHDHHHEHHHDDHGSHAGHADIYQRRFIISLILSIPVVIYSHMVQEWLGFTPPDFNGSHLVAPVLGTIVFLYGGWVFLEGGWSEIRIRQPGMMLLITLAIGVAFIASMATSLGYFDLDFWWELALLVTIMLLGHWLEMRALGQAQGSLDALASLLPDEAEVIHHGETHTVPINELKQGDTVLVRPGGRVPADGTISDGTAELDESMLTGETRPVPKSPGDTVVAGTVVAGSSIRVTVDAIGEETALAGIQRLVQQAQESRSRAQALADRFAAALFYVALTAGLTTFIIWSLLGDVDAAVSRTVTVLIISCPHALGLAIPLVTAITTSLAARQGILVKDRLALERMRSIDTVLFDKTGTLTLGEHAVTDMAATTDDPSDVLALAAAAESDSEHPVARAIVRAAREREITIPTATDFRASAGRGVEARVDGVQITVGGPAMLRERGLESPPVLREQISEWSERGGSVLHIVRDDEVIGALALEDQIRTESRQAVDELQAAGVRVVMITGDAQQVASAVAAELGIDEVFADVLPEDKDSKVIELQERGERVAMVGDGVNDAPALARAEVGIAIGAGTDVAIESAGVILASNDPRSVMRIVQLSKAGYRKMVQNLGWAAGYNLVAIPLAAGVLAPIGFILPPAVGAILMSASTIVVALNAQLLRRLDLSP